MGIVTFFTHKKYTKRELWRWNFYISCFGKGRFLERSRNVGYESVCFRRGRVRRGWDPKDDVCSAFKRRRCVWGNSSGNWSALLNPGRAAKREYSTEQKRGGRTGIELSTDASWNGAAKRRRWRTWAVWFGKSGVRKDFQTGETVYVWCRRKSVSSGGISSRNRHREQCYQSCARSWMDAGHRTCLSNRDRSNDRDE